MRRAFIALLILFSAASLWAQDVQNNPNSNHANKFEQLEINENM